MAKRVLFTEQARAVFAPSNSPAALQILKTVARFLESGEGNVKRLQGVDPPLLRLSTQDRRVIFRDLGDAIEIQRVRDRKQAYG